MYSYRAYGLGFHSELCLPELKIELGSFDVEIKREKLDALFPYPASEDGAFWSTDSDAYFYYAKVASIQVHEGREIVVDLKPGADLQIFRMYLLGRVFGALLHQRGLLVLHGSAVAKNGRAAAFIGRSGSGKSTASAALCAKGYTFVADDLVVIDTAGTTPVVHPSFPQIKLWPDAASYLGYSPESMPRVIPDEAKRYSNISDFSSYPVPLRQIYILEKGEPVGVELLRQKEAIIELVRYSYASGPLINGSNLRPHFSQCAQAAKEIPVCRLVRPFSLEALPQFASIVENDIKEA